MKVTLGATIPVVQYGNLQPLVEVEAETVKGGLDEALDAIAHIWNRTCDKPLMLRDVVEHVSATVRLYCWACKGMRSLLFDPVAHSYGEPGESWLSGSAFAGLYTKDFPGEIIAKKMSSKYGVADRDILGMWEKNAEASSGFGTGVHAALEMYGKFAETSRAVKEGSDESALTKNPTMRPIVEKFFAGREHELAAYEAFVADFERGWCGQIDRILIEDDGIWVEDFKTNSDLHKSDKIADPYSGVVPDTKLGGFWLQLSFYADILRAHGETVKGLRVHHWDGEDWVPYEHPVVEIVGDPRGHA